jgi:hypothetical protein
MDVPAFMDFSTEEVDNPVELPAYTLEVASVSEPIPSNQPEDQSILDSPRAPDSEPPPQERSAHTYVLKNRNNKPWATLTLQSSARSSQHMPTFMDDEPVEGSLLLSLGKKESITSVTIVASYYLPIMVLFLTALYRSKGQLLQKNAWPSAALTYFLMTPMFSGQNRVATFEHPLPFHCPQKSDKVIVSRGVISGHSPS